MTTTTITAPQTLIVYGIPLVGISKQPENVEALQKLINDYWEIVKGSWKVPCHLQDEIKILYKPRIFLKEDVFGVVIGSIGGTLGFYEMIPMHISVETKWFESYPKVTGIKAFNLFDSWRLAIYGTTVVGKDFYFSPVKEANSSLFLVGATSLS